MPKQAFLFGCARASKQRIRADPYQVGHPCLTCPRHGAQKENKRDVLYIYTIRENVNFPRFCFSE